MDIRGGRFPIGVGIDTARYGHHVTFLSPDRKPVAPSLSVAESREGYKKFLRQLEAIHSRHPDAHFHFRIDAAGQYAANLEQFLRSVELPKTISVGEPKRNKDYHRALFPKRKADATESHAMARYAVVELPPATTPLSSEIVLLREIASRLEGQVKSCTQAINRLHNLMARVFPELESVAPHFAAAWVLTLLKQYPTAQQIAQARPATLAKIPHVTAGRAQQLQALARTSVASLKGPCAQQLVVDATCEVRHCQERVERTEKLLLQAFEALPPSAHRQIETIPGIGAVTAAVLVAKIVEITRFETPEKLIGYFGVFPEERSSGVDKAGKPQIRATHMSRKGSDLVRRYLFCAAKSAITHNPAAAALYRRLRARGTRGDVALGHAMRKLLQLVFGVWTSNKPFDKQHYPWEPAANPSGHPAGELATAESAAQQNAAGHRREVIPARKVVTAANARLQQRGPSVNQCKPKLAKKRLVDFAYLREQVTIEQVLQQLGCKKTLHGRGPERRGPCPIHQAAGGRSRSFSVNLHKNVFQCFHPPCGAHGGALDLWAAVRQETIYEAALSLAETLQLETARNREAGARKPKAR